MTELHIAIERTWDGGIARADEAATLQLTAAQDGLRVRLQAPLHGDPAPPHPPGPTPGLWTHEVVELFLCDGGSRYLELEFGPGGHYLVLELDGVRTPVSQGHRLDARFDRSETSWSAEVHVPGSLLPANLTRYNAYAIHGVGAARRYLAAHPVPGATPDFHRLECFEPLPSALLAALRGSAERAGV